jgi:ribosome-associated protein
MARIEKEREIADLPRQVITAVQSASDKKATDIIVLDLREAGGFTDYFIICTGQNIRQIKAISEAIQESLRKELDEKHVIAEGTEKSGWLLLDYFSFVVHIFSHDFRAYYDLERLWGTATKHEFTDATLSQYRK